jgi:hypothetical protein
MFRRLSSTLLFALALSFLIPPTTTIAQTTPEASSPLDVLYLVTGTEIQTYNVDPQSGVPTKYGVSAIPLPAYPTVVPSLDDRFLYILGNNIETKTSILLVYQTDSNGVPQNPPIQTMNFRTSVSNFVLDSRGAFAYAVRSRQNSQQQTLAEIRSFTVNPQTGLLVESPKPRATYPPNGPCGTGLLDSGLFFLVGFNSSRNQLYDEWFCAALDTETSRFYTRQVDQHTGALGPDVPLTTGGSSGTGQIFSVNITPIAILNYYNAGFNGNENSLSVYPPTGGTTPIFTCAWAMLALCGTSGAEIPDRSGNYIFFSTNQGGAEVTKLDLNESKIVDLGISIPDFVEAFSLDDKLIYGQSKSYGRQPVMPIYVFDPGSGSITNRSEVPLPSPYSTPVPALRN